MPPAVPVLVNATGLAAGQYYGRVQVAGAASNSPQRLVVVLNVLPGGQNPGPVVQPAGLVFISTQGGSSPGSQTVRISNITPGTLTFTSGVSTDSVNVLLVVTPPPQPGGFRALAGCTPTRLLLVANRIGADFNVSAGWPQAVAAMVVDDCGTFVTLGSVVASFWNGDAPLSLDSAGDGNWSSTWTPQGTPDGVTITFSGQSGSLSGTQTLSGGLAANPDVPVVPDGAILSAASYELGAPQAPGGFLAIFGTRLADSLNAATTLPLDTSRAGTEVIVDGLSLPIHFVSSGQVNAILNYNLTPNTTHQLIVMRGNTLSAPRSFAVAPARPGVFAVNNRGFGQGHIYVSGPGGVLTLADAANPARAGDVIVFFAAGLGPVDPPVAAGAQNPFDVLSRVTSPMSITIGGVEARVEFAGLFPGFASGTYQVNATVPAGITPGSAVPMVVTVAGQPGPPVTLAVQ